MITFFLEAITVLQLEKVFTVSDLLSDSKVYLPIALVMVGLMFWWALDSEFKLRETWNEQPNILDVQDDRLEIMTGTMDNLVRYGEHSSFGYLLEHFSGRMYLLYIDFINKPKVAKSNPA